MIAAVAALDDTTRRRLVLAKQLYRSALPEGLTPGTSYGRILAVVTLDLANETMLYATASTLLPAHKQPHHEFEKLVVQVDGLFETSGRESLPERRNVLTVHRHRNNAQHRAEVPTDEEVGDCRVYSRDFLEGMTQSVWGQSFAGLSMVQAVRSDRTRRLLSDAEGALSRGEFLTATRDAHAALRVAMMMVRDTFVGPRDAFWRVSALGAYSDPPSSSLDTAAKEAIESLQTTVLHLALDIDGKRLRRITEITGHHDWIAGADRPLWRDDKPEPKRDTAEWVLAYCTDSILTIESKSGDFKESLDADEDG